MGRYHDWEDVIGRYDEAGRFSGGSEIVDSFYVPFGEAMVDGALGGFFTLPFSNNNFTVKDLAIDATFIKMALFKAEAMQELRDSFKERVDALRSGKMAMVAVDGTVIGLAASTIASTTEDYQPTFDVGPAEDWLVGSDQLQDLEDAKS